MKTFFKILLATILVASVALGIVGYRLFSLPTTAEMSEFFSENQSAFVLKNAEILSAVAQKKSINLQADAGIGYRWLEVQPDSHSYQNSDPITVRYYTHMRGIGVSAFGTGIAYLDSEIEKNIYPSLETMINLAKNVEGFIGYSHIVDNWYSFFWEAD